MREAVTADRLRHGVLSMGSLEECDRATWLKFRNTFPVGVENLAPLADAGESGERMTVERLKLVTGLEIVDRDPADPTRPLTFLDIDNHFKGDVSGVILGVAAAPATWHVLDCMPVGSLNLARFRKSKSTVGDKAALQNWNMRRYIRAQLAMHYSGLTRHYFVAGMIDGTDYESCRTEYDMTFAVRQIERARRIITDNQPPPRISEDASFELCRECTVALVCRHKLKAVRDCRNCIHSKPVEAGKWNCERWAKILHSFEPCGAHKYIPDLIDGRIIEADDASITYKMPDATIWKDGEK